eukprot:scaffold83_cov246-Pinguiococcus_pyrenoidosus.AAC.23
MADKERARTRRHISRFPALPFTLYTISRCAGSKLRNFSAPCRTGEEGSQGLIVVEDLIGDALRNHGSRSRARGFLQEDVDPMLHPAPSPLLLQPPDLVIVEGVPGFGGRALFSLDSALPVALPGHPLRRQKERPRRRHHTEREQQRSLLLPVSREGAAFRGRRKKHVLFYVAAIASDWELPHHGTTSDAVHGFPNEEAETRRREEWLWNDEVLDVEIHDLDTHARNRSLWCENAHLELSRASKRITDCLVADQSAIC